MHETMEGARRRTAAMWCVALQLQWKHRCLAILLDVIVTLQMRRRGNRVGIPRQFFSPGPGGMADSCPSPPLRALAPPHPNHRLLAHTHWGRSPRSTCRASGRNGLVSPERTMATENRLVEHGSGHGQNKRRGQGKSLLRAAGGEKRECQQRRPEVRCCVPSSFFAAAWAPACTRCRSFLDANSMSRRNPDRSSFSLSRNWASCAPALWAVSCSRVAAC